jgi:hypothetical protein
MSFVSWFKNLNSDLTAVAAPGIAVRDSRGGQYYIRLHGRGSMDPGPVGPVSWPFWIGGWVNHLLRHHREWEVYLDECPAEPNIDFEHLEPPLSQTYTSPREAAQARNHLAALIQQPMDA